METLIKWLPSGFAAVFITALIVLFITSLSIWTKKREEQANSECRAGIRKLNEAQKIIEEGYQCRWNPMTDPKYTKLFHPIYS